MAGGMGPNVGGGVKQLKDYSPVANLSSNKYINRY
jgi:hypothetical protein